MKGLKHSRGRWLSPCPVKSWLFTLISSLVASSVVMCLENQYDFIIVGGGTAGCTLGSRLSESGRFSVLVVESGSMKEGMDVPVSAPHFVGDSEVTFQYSSLPQRYAGRQHDGNLTYVSGRVLGGTSSINFMWFNRGHPNDWDNWANITGDNSWSYSNMLPYFKRTENYKGDYRTDQHGYYGPVSISQPRYAPGLQHWLAAGREVGYPIADSNGPQKVSFGPIEFSKQHGRRESAFSAYIKPVLTSRPNLHILMNTNVTKILFQGITAIGVQFHTSSASETRDGVVYVSKEVIVSAGVIGSPLLLQRSGIGPKSLLEAAGIPVIQNLPVGANFRDHVILPIYLHINNDSMVLDEERDLTRENYQIYRMTGDGPYSSTKGATGQAFFMSSIARLEEGQRSWPDLHIGMFHCVQPPIPSDFLIKTKNSLPVSSSKVPMSALIFLTRPQSDGAVYINPHDVDGPPLLDLGFFSSPRDIRRLLDGVRETIKIFEHTSSYQKLGAQIVPLQFPACHNRITRSDQYWKCYIRQASTTGNHAGGTCRMGSSMYDSKAVVDSSLRVMGIAGLRVVDASIMPVPTNSNPQAAVYGIAEKAADMILSYWNYAYF